MDKKLTLSLNQGVIDDAKVYAKSNNTSLSKLIESYLASLTKNTTTAPQITPLVKSLSGVIDIPADFDAKKAYGEFLAEKYS
ncbi:MAG: DUF6364 family protein [Flavobacteriaceae bacterium]